MPDGTSPAHSGILSEERRTTDVDGSRRWTAGPITRAFQTGRSHQISEWHGQQVVHRESGGVVVERGDLRPACDAADGNHVLHRTITTARLHLFDSIARVYNTQRIRISNCHASPGQWKQGFQRKITPIRCPVFLGKLTRASSKEAHKTARC